MNNRKCIIIAAADGIFSLQTGVGIVVNSFFEAIDKIIPIDWKTGGIALYSFAPKVNQNSADYSQIARDIVAEACLRYDGDLLELHASISGNSLNEVWKGTSDFQPSKVWKELCIELAEKADQLSTDFEEVYLITHDTLFAELSKFVKEKNVKVCWVPHSLSTLFPVPNQEERLAFETRSIDSILERDDKIGYISFETKEHLMTHYGVPAQTIISFYSGIYFDSYRYKNKKQLNDFFRSYNIPVEKDLIFTWARCSDQKGIDVIIQSYILLHKNAPIEAARYHLVLLTPTETSYNDYLEKVLILLDDLSPDTYSFITSFQESVQYEILAYERTKCVLLCSRFESFGLTSIESLFFSSTNTCIIYSPIPTFKEVLSGFSNTLELKENNPEELFKAILNSTGSETTMSSLDISRKDVYKKYSFVTNHRGGLNTFIEWKI